MYFDELLKNDEDYKKGIINKEELSNNIKELKQNFKEFLFIVWEIEDYINKEV